MAGGSPQHSTITVNTTITFGTQLRGRPCQAFDSNQKVRIPSEELFTYPDLSVVCGEPQYHDTEADVLLNPTVLIEVLSPSTEAYDRGLKFDRYAEIPSLTDYVLISQSEPRIEHFSRAGGETWVRSVVVGLDTELRIESVGVVLRLSDVYDRLNFSKA
jgi:Uma2 family endonuclease